MHQQEPVSVNRLRYKLLILLVSLISLSAHAEGTNQLGANHDIHESTVIKVDVLAVGEVIHITLGNNTAGDGNVSVTVIGPDGNGVSGSPFTIGPGLMGHAQTGGRPLTTEQVANALKIPTSMVGTYTITFDNSVDEYIDPLDITVAPKDAQQIDPDTPPDGGRVYSTRWRLQNTKPLSPVLYSLVPVNATENVVYKLEFNGLWVDGDWDLLANSFGIPGYPLSSVPGSPPPCDFDSELVGDICLPIVPEQYAVYLNMPKKGLGLKSLLALSGDILGPPNSSCTGVIPGQENLISISTQTAGTFWLLVDLNNDGQFRLADGELVYLGDAVVGDNSIPFDGLDLNGHPIPAGSYKMRLQLRVGELHVPLSNVMQLQPGLRIMNTLPPKPDGLTTKLFWDDTLVNDTPAKVIPVSTLPNGIDSGDQTTSVICSNKDPKANAHCWPAVDGVGVGRVINTWVVAKTANLDLTITVLDPLGDPDNDQLSTLDECTIHDTDPQKPDSDDGGVPDGVEVKTDKTDPNNTDDDLHCSTGKRDGSETDVDCGGPKCGKCDSGETCELDLDCHSDSCENKICSADSCADKRLNGDETDIDCGGSCKPCTEGQSCVGHLDCASGNCLSDVCQKGSCNDGIENGDETDIDCGASCSPCEEGKSCVDHLDCESNNCSNQQCQKGSCNDGIGNGDESDIDCGGSCNPCDTGDHCFVDVDCDSLNCQNGSCKEANCSDGIANGDESDIDCGGSCGPCADNQHCSSNSDCQSDFCDTDLTCQTVISVIEYCPNAIDPDDCDQDGLSNEIEDANGNGLHDQGETDFNNPDTDFDGILDGLEDSNQNGVVDSGETDPRKLDSDDDSVADGVEDKNKNGIVDPGESNPTQSDPLVSRGGGGCVQLPSGQPPVWLLVLTGLLLVGLRRLRLS